MAQEVVDDWKGKNKHCGHRDGNIREQFPLLQPGIKVTNLGLTDLEVWGEPVGPGNHTSGEVPMLIPQALGGKALGAGHRPLRRVLPGWCGHTWEAWWHWFGSVKRHRELEPITLRSHWGNNSKIRWQIGRSKFLLPPPAFPVGRT